MASVDCSFNRRIWGNLKRSLVFSPAIGSAGGLVCSWDPDFLIVTAQVIKSNFIVLFGEIRPRELKIGFVNVYGPSTNAEKREFFSELSDLISSYNIPWILGGDFNVFLHLDEKIGFSYNNASIGIFNEFVHNVRGIDLPLKGGSFTWCNNRDPPTFVRLDRFLVTVEILLAYPSLSQILLTKALSDHNAILLQSASQNWGPKPFKFFNHWFVKHGLDDLVKSVLHSRHSDGHSRGIVGLLSDSKSAIKSWANLNCRDIRSKICNLESQIHELELKIQSGGPRIPEIEDRNTRYFHLCASLRRNQNEISFLKEGNRVCSEPDEIKATVKNHFYSAFNCCGAIEIESMNLPFQRLNYAQIQQLESSFSESEIWEVINNFDGNRAPGPDGFNLNFFKRYWSQLKNDILKFFSDFYHHRNWVANINHSFLVLIPKKPNPDSLDDFRPISLVNGVYKILAKVLGNRLRKVMDCLISKTQFAFIPGHQILDCSLIANEVIDSVQRLGSMGMALKIDFKKAYDSVDWNFLLKIMEAMGFGERWRRWVLCCISTVSISVLVNGSPTERFNISRGLRQGCPLSPLLFNLVGESLSLMLGKGVDVGLFFGLRVGRNHNSIAISHLQFADDLLVFCEAKETHVLAVRRVLRVFELASGLHINIKKSRLFGINVAQDTLMAWSSAIGSVVGSFPSEYLGLPLGVRRNSTALWDPLIKKLSSCMTSWKSSQLSFAGRITLVKSVMSAVPIYYMSLFRMSSGVCNRITGMVSNFLWGGSVDKRKIHWVKWEMLCRPVQDGGLGFTNFGTQNRCLLGKWMIRFGSDSDCLWKEVISCKYNVIGLPLIPPPPNPRISFSVWKDILISFYKSDDLGLTFRNNLALQVGDGKSISFWTDKWACDLPLSLKFPRIFALAKKKSGVIADFGARCGNSWIWNIQLRRILFDWEIPIWNAFHFLLSNFQSSRLQKDWVKWLGSGDGLFSSKSLRSLVAPDFRSIVNWEKVVWLGFAPPKVEAFVWLLLHGRVPVKDELFKRGILPSSDNFCFFCNNAPETVKHLFFSCNFSWHIWAMLGNYWGISMVLHQNPMAFFLAWPQLLTSWAHDHMWLLIPYAVIWSIWLHRNEIAFQSKILDTSQLLFTVKMRAAWWFKAKKLDSSISLESIFSDPSLSSSFNKPNHNRDARCSWQPPPMGFLKYNVDGACDKAGRCGIGGVLRNHRGSILQEFSKSAGSGSSTLAEILAIKFAIESFVNSEWFSSSRLIIESDSKVAVDWISFPSSSNPTFSNLIQELNVYFITDRWMLRNIRRSQNTRADILAKSGIG
ncbi:hypothetical protein GQ457_13G010790 [Hibiscus cannabinus]